MVKPKPIVFFAVFLFISPYSFLLSASKSPYVHSPLLLIDCQKNDAVFQKSCFRQIAYLTRIVVASGLFEDVLSPSNIYFVTQLRKGFVSFEQKRPYKSSKWKDFILERYRHVFRFSVGRLHRYVLISVSESKFLREQTSYQLQLAELKKSLQVYLDARRIHYRFASPKDDEANATTQNPTQDPTQNQKEFENLLKRNFVQMGASLRIELEQTSDLFQKRNQLLQIENELKKIANVKSVFSAADVFAELQLLFGTKTWQQAFRYWEFSDETRSLYFQKHLPEFTTGETQEKSKEDQGGAYYISLYQRDGQPIAKEAILKVLNNKKINPFKASVKMYAPKPLVLPNREDLEPANNEKNEENKNSDKEVSLSLLSF